MSDLPIIAITMGDPAGIGPEIILKALVCEDVYHLCRPLVIGDLGVLRKVSKESGSPAFHVVSTPAEVKGRLGLLDIIPVSHLKEDSFVPGQPTLDGGKAMVDYILKAVDLVKAHQASAMVTGPISKELMHRAGFRFDGHTELLAHLTHTDDYVMMLAGSRLRVSFATIHCALREVPQRLNKGLIQKTIAITSHALVRDFGLERPHLAVAALNPHAGESGAFGAEDDEIIRPAVEEAQKQGLVVDGPFPADTVFYHAMKGRFDAVVAMYHDQGSIPLKLLHFSDGVNITLGLPIIRTSVDHGTAYDIAGRGVADPSSLKAAIAMAATVAGTRKSREGSHVPEARIIGAGNSTKPRS
jgi:4-hydroxythreonine-4-phosphate dehydrogenase